MSGIITLIIHLVSIKGWIIFVIKKRAKRKKERIVPFLRLSESRTSPSQNDGALFWQNIAIKHKGTILFGSKLRHFMIIQKCTFFNMFSFLDLKLNYFLYIKNFVNNIFEMVVEKWDIHFISCQIKHFMLAASHLFTSHSFGRWSSFSEWVNRPGWPPLLEPKLSIETRENIWDSEWFWPSGSIQKFCLENHCGNNWKLRRVNA